MACLAKEVGIPALAITDSGNLFGALEFSDALGEKGIQPIIGCSLRVETHAAPDRCDGEDPAACPRSCRPWLFSPRMKRVIAT